MSKSVHTYRQRLHCNVRQVDDIFEGCMHEASRVFTQAGMDAYLDAASTVCGLGRGTELVLIFLEEMPAVAKIAGEGIVTDVADMARMFSHTANGQAINPFLVSLPSVARRLEEAELLREYFHLVEMVTAQASEGLIPFLHQAEYLLSQLCIGGLKNWIQTGIEGYSQQSYRYGDYFSLQSADSRAALQRERHGTLYVDQERNLAQYLLAFWQLDVECHHYSLAFSTLRKPTPYIDSHGFHLPDVYDDAEDVRGLDRYRALLAHLAAHYCYTTPIIADNFSPFQQLVIETFEDARIEALAMQRFPGLRRLWKRLHPVPAEDACPEKHSCIRHKLAMLSRALLDPQDHPYTDPLLLDYVERFNRRFTKDPHDVTLSSELGVEYLTEIHTSDFRLPKIWFKDTEVGYRDDNRYLWIFLEDTEDEDEFHSDHAAANPRNIEEEEELFVRHLKEWDYTEERYRPDWVTLYEAIQPPARAEVINNLLERHKLLAKKLRKLVDLLKPQQQVRIRYQEDGDELDLDIALRAMVEYRSGSTPDPRIHMSHRTDGRDISVLLLLDLSQSINEVPDGCEQTILQLSQEAVSLLAWSIDALGDPFAIAGFASNTRHEVRYLHFKGFSEAWGDAPKARLAAMEGGLSTRMGAAIRNAGYYLGKRNTEKRLMLVLTDGAPHDVDVEDMDYLIEDTKKAVKEAADQGVITYCITLDPKADDYVANIFGNGHYTVIDHIEQLPEKLPQLFMALTK